MKTGANNNRSRWGLIGLAAAFLLAAVPIFIQARAADAEHHRHLTAATHEIDSCCVLKTQGRFSKKAAADGFSKRVAEIRKMLGTDTH